MRILFTVAFICCALVAPTVAHESNDSQQLKSDITRAPRPPSRWWTTEKYRQELRLTAEQSAEIERIVQGSMSRLKGDKEDLDQAQSDSRWPVARSARSARSCSCGFTAFSRRNNGEALTRLRNGTRPSGVARNNSPRT
jgi:hypothetical protein